MTTQTLTTRLAIQSPILSISDILKALVIFGFVATYFFTKHSFLMCAFYLGFVVIYWLKKRDYLHPMIPMVIAVQWLQTGMVVVYCEINGITINDMYGNWFVDDAVLLTGMSVIALGVGMWLPNCVKPSFSIHQLQRHIQTLDGKRAFSLYVVFVVGNYLLTDVLYDINELRQLSLAASGLKWIAFYLVALSAVTHHRYIGFLALAVILEVFIGSLGFFSQFRTAFIVMLLAVLSMRGVKIRRLATIGVVALLVLLTLMLMWTGIKKNYRAHVNLGNRQQVILVSTPERLSTMVAMIADLSLQDYKASVGDLMQRIGYVEYFSHVIRNVPTNVPYQEGALTLGVFKHITKPRILFPDKAVLPSDTFVTEKFTQLRIVSQASQFTNIPIGYIGETYVDYGPPWMFSIVFGLGLAIGFIHRIMMSIGKHGLLYCGVFVVSGLPVILLETSLAKLVGGFLSSLIVTTLFIYATREYLSNYLWIAPPANQHKNYA